MPARELQEQLNTLREQLSRTHRFRKQNAPICRN